MKSGVDLIAEERKRQVEEENWDEEHDRELPVGDLAVFGACYVLDFAARYSGQHETWRAKYNKASKALFPFDDEWWKPTPDNPIKQLIKAGALIAAEIDRLLLPPKSN